MNGEHGLSKEYRNYVDSRNEIMDSSEFIGRIKENNNNKFELRSLH
jgi:hypothetical protein